MEESELLSDLLAQLAQEDLLELLLLPLDKQCPTWICIQGVPSGRYQLNLFRYFDET